MKSSIIISLAVLSAGTTATVRASEPCMAAVYSDGFGRPLADGKRHSADELLVAHRKLPFGTIVDIKLIQTGKTVRAVVRDRGPYVPNICVDVSRGTARALGLTGLGRVTIEPVVASAASQVLTK